MEELKRSYSLTDSELIIVASNFADNMNRDATEFAARGVDAAAITAFIALSDEFEAIPPDTYYAALLRGKRETRDATRASMTALIQKISGYFDQEYGIDSWQYQSLGISNLMNMSQGKFLVAAKMVVDVAGDYVLTLGTIGLTQADIDSLSALITTFETNLNEVNSAKTTRDSKTRERILKGNELYSYVSKYGKIGKLIWENVDESKYNDYQIYHRGTGLPSKVEDLNYDIANTKIKWSPAANADEYQLEERRNDPAFDWVTIYEGTAIEFVHTPATGSWLYRCRGRNDTGYGAFSDELAVDQPA